MRTAFYIFFDLTLASGINKSLHQRQNSSACFQQRIINPLYGHQQKNGGISWEIHIYTHKYLHFK